MSESMPENQPAPKDPIQTGSLSKPIFISSVLMLAATLLCMYDEFWWRRPYKDYQLQFRIHYLNHLDKLLPKQRQALAEVQDSDEYRALYAKYESKVAETSPRNAEIDRELVTVVSTNITNLNAALKNVRAEYASLMYLLETAGDDETRKNVGSELDRVRRGPYPLEQVEGEAIAKHECDFEELKSRYAAMEAQKAALEKERGQLALPVSNIKKELDAYLNKNLKGLHPVAVSQLIQKVEDEDTLKGMFAEIKQIHIAEFDWVDRCESCHLGTREPVDMTAADVGGQVVFASHPNRELLQIHDPDTFGCSMCHNGNGRSVTSVKLAHGTNKHWLYPLYPRGNFEAGCVQCHTDDLVLSHAPTLNEGKWIFKHQGCWGCHPYKGFDTEPAAMALIEKNLERLQLQKEKLEIEKNVSKGAERNALDLQISSLVTEMDESRSDLGQLSVERQKVGPDLNNVRAKLNPDFIIPWIMAPQDFRHSTKMPTFRISEDEATAVAAYIWQTASAPTPPRHEPGDATRGRELFTSRGCLGCHTVELDGKTVGDGFAADLSREGDKANYDFLVEWIKEPTSGVMPNLRLTWQESRDIASFLMEQNQGSSWPSTGQQLEDSTQRDRGLKWIRHYGCAGCHNIPGLEQEGKIGVDLTVEGSKPKERLDFGRVEHDYKMGKTQKIPSLSGDVRELTGYTHKSFFETKLTQPDYFGTGKVYETREEELRMPSFRFSNQEVDALTTFLLGSVESEIPQNWRYNPDRRRKAIQEGWWIVRKYNCVGCHQFEAETQPSLWGLPQYNGNVTLENGDSVSKASYRPPSLVGQGLRTDPDWLAAFLRNPSLTHNEDMSHRNGVRGYLQIRMPSFRMSDREIAKLVRFFGALSIQPEPFIKPRIKPLTPTELGYAREVFKGVKCVGCHAIGDPTHDVNAIAPSLTLTGDRLKSAWLHRWLVNPQVLMPGTNMPSNIDAEYEITLGSGRTVVGTQWDPRAGTLKIKGVPEPVDVSTYVGKPRILRYVVVGFAEEYEGDHRELLLRYLINNYDETEIPFGMPDQ